MNQSERDVLKRLGSRGLNRVLADLLDPSRLVKLANACGLRYPGMRTQSQKRERIVADLVERAEREDAARRTIHRTLTKETTAAARRFASLPPEERARRVKDEGLLSAPGALGLHLFLVAASGSEDDLAPLLSRCDAKPAPAPAEEPSVATLSKEVSRLRKKNQELQKKVHYVDGQVAKLREAEKTQKREIIRRKGELAESRMLAERLRREIQSAKPSPPPAATATGRAADSAAAPKPADATLEEVARSVRKLGQDQKKIVHAVEKSAAAPPAAVEVPAETLAPILAAIDDMKKETFAARRERKKDEQQQDRILEELRAELKALRSAAEEGQGPALSPTSRRRRGKGENARVGVFIDVQNVYYAARQLKGKLDFDALLQAVVRGRRLIQAKAYVVESQEIDQSGFIAMLQQRAIEVRRKTLKIRSDGSMKGDWDMEMALDILDATPSLDVVVLVSGDGDFTSLVNRVKAMGPRVEVVAFPRNTAKSLLEAADEFQPLDRKFMIRSGLAEAGAAPEGREPGRLATALASAKPTSGSSSPTERARTAVAASPAEGPAAEEAPAGAQK